MIVSGGTYRERLLVGGGSADLGGSGLRAALAVPSVTQLITATEPELAPMLKGVGRTFSLDIDNVGRDKTVGFTYFAPFVEPTVHGSSARLGGPIHLVAEAALAFGMVEHGDRTIEVESLVYDPQSATDRAADVMTNASFERAVLCANVLEIESMGSGDTLEEIAQSIRRSLGLSAVVVKAGARGCLVVEDAGSQWIGAVPSSTVRKLGSGDVFSAVFAHAWTTGSGTVDSARTASFATSWWVSHQADQIPASVLQREYWGSAGEELDNAGQVPRIYLAGPFFTVAEVWLIEQCRAFLRHAGASVFSPLHDVGLGGDEVASQDLEGLEGADAVFAILDGWDPGTLFEVGWANRKGIPIVGVASQLDPIRTTMLSGTGSELHKDFTTGMYRAIWRGLGHGRERDE
jgi:nucleoside 2-deoxyribosyltransferase